MNGGTRRWKSPDCDEELIRGRCPECDAAPRVPVQSDGVDALAVVEHAPAIAWTYTPEEP